MEMRLSQISSVYFVGIGGIGMSALARYMQQLGKYVAGYDRTSSDLTETLQQEGIEIIFREDKNLIPKEHFEEKETLVVYTPAVPAENNLLSYFNNNGYEVVKRAELLGAVTRDTFCLAVAGTHGKTTTSAILGHLLAFCNMPVTAFLGGISENYQSNYIAKGNEISVVEADEFDRSFLQLSPDVACITTMDADHLDIYGDQVQLEESFMEFAGLVENKKNVFYKKGLPLQGSDVAVDEQADYSAQNIRIEDGNFVFDLHTPLEIIRDMVFQLPGRHNLHNAVTALGMAIAAGTPTPCLPKALRTFKGVQRRFTYRIKTAEQVLIDDYAHHPTELDALHQAVSEMYPGEPKLIAFQPHLYSRTRDFAQGFAESLDRFDEVLLLDIYPARELSIEGVNSEWLLNMMKGNNKDLVSKEELPERMRASSCRIKLIVGAGDIGAEVDKVTKYLKNAS